MKHIFFISCLIVCSLSSVHAQRMDDKSQHSPYIQAVDEYRPAPGQFINDLPKYVEGDNATTMAAKCTEALAENNKGMVCLGSWGGYIVFHFDHSIANIPGQRDIYFLGNAFQGAATSTAGGSSEPGIVMVSKDINRNGIADDPWYEIAGSGDRDSLSLMRFGYQATYTPNPMGNIPWTDNQGNTGSVLRNAFHSQEYFPQWIEGPLTFSGTRLPDNASDESGTGTYWVQHFMDYGYVDNRPNTDTLSCSIDLGWAVDPITRDTVDIDFVDFVKVYSGVLQDCGWLGEESTEILGAEDLHLEASIAAIKSAITTDITTIGGDNPAVTDPHWYTLDGQRLDRRPTHRGIYIKGGKKYVVR